MGEIRYHGSCRVYRAAITSTAWVWKQMGELDDRIGLVVRWADVLEEERYDKEAETTQVIKYFGVYASWDGRFKTYVASDVGALFHSVTASGSLLEVGKNKPVGVTVSGYAWAIKPPAGSSDTWGGFMYAGTNVSPAVDPKWSKFGEFSKFDFALIPSRVTTSKALMQWALSSASSLLESVPT